ncbi:MAG: MiaB/RimO family radical SAM methylthiotransferase [Planctomycetes bacterium]|nr:MiaB/RimO family radical SAM methylthiotransferase [Planctomycetota bacterium]
MSDANTRKVYLETFGCQMNVLDSELVVAQLRSLGYVVTPDPAGADVVLYNTCSVRQAAEDKVYGRLGEATHLKKANRDVVVGVIGCMAERDGATLMKRYPQVDLMCGPGELDKVPLLIDNVVKTRHRQTALQGHNARRSSTLAAAADELELLDLSRSISAEDHNGSAYVRITRGCNKFCTYCVVPFTRGAEVHRPPEHIIDECKRLADAGVIEVTLLGQTVNHYRYDHGAAVSVNGVEQPQVGPGGGAFRNPDSKFNVGRRVTSFADLLKRIHDEVPAIARLRFVTSYPRDFGDDILQVMADSPRICRYLHVPAQSGSDRVLKIMNREYTVEEYVNFIDRARRFMPDVQFASDFIVGFPTETDAEFVMTIDLVRRCRFKNSFIFKYSPRPGTLAIDKYADDVDEDTKRYRNMKLLEVQAEVSQQVSNEQIGRTLEVMVEGVSQHVKRGVARRGDLSPPASNVELRWEQTEAATQLTGRTGGDLIVMFDGPAEMIGRIVPVKIHTAKPLALFGDRVEAAATV